jgi:hypothetical protein
MTAAMRTRLGGSHPPGLVRHERNRGVQVQTWSVHDLDEIFSLRSVLEPWGCRLAAAGGTVEVAPDGRPTDVDELTELNNRFHRMILEASGNSRLTGVDLFPVQPGGTAPQPGPPPRARGGPRRTGPRLGGVGHAQPRPRGMALHPAGPRPLTPDPGAARGARPAIVGHQFTRASPDARPFCV